MCGVQVQCSGQELESARVGCLTLCTHEYKGDREASLCKLTVHQQNQQLWKARCCSGLNVASMKRCWTPLHRFFMKSVYIPMITKGVVTMNLTHAGISMCWQVSETTSLWHTTNSFCVHWQPKCLNIPIFAQKFFASLLRQMSDATEISITAYLVHFLLYGWSWWHKLDFCCRSAMQFITQHSCSHWVRDHCLLSLLLPVCFNIHTLHCRASVCHRVNHYSLRSARPQLTTHTHQNIRLKKASMNLAATLSTHVVRHILTIFFVPHILACNLHAHATHKEFVAMKGSR